MKLEATSDETVGIEFCHAAYRMALLTLHGGTPKLIALVSAPNDVKPLYTNFLSEHRAAAQRALAITALSCGSMIVRTLEVPVTRGRDLDAIVSYQAEPILPYPLNEALLAYQVVSQSEGNTKLSVLSCAQEQMRTHLEHASSAGIDPEAVSGVPAALAMFAQVVCGRSAPTLIAHVGALESCVVLARNGTVDGSYSLPVGYQDLVHALAQDLSLSNEEAHATLSTDGSLLDKGHSHLNAVVERIQQELARATTSLLHQGKRPDHAVPLLVTGYGAIIDDLQKRLSTQVDLTPVVCSEQEGFGDSTLREYGVAIGLAYSALSNSPAPLNLRQGPLAYARPYKRLILPALTTVTALLTCLCLLFASGKQRLTKQKLQLRERYAAVLATAGTSAEQLERDYRKANRHLPPLAEGETVSLVSISTADIASRLAFLDKRIKSAPTDFPLYPNVPRVCDLLAWLEQHPALVDTDGKTPLISIDSLSYSIVKRPSKSRKSEKYQVKVELEFSAAQPRDARAFHDALIAPNPMVDPRGDVKWSSSRGIYRTSFFLKDQTAYPR